MYKGGVLGMSNLLSIDWDYFIPLRQEWSGSYLENEKNIISIWYKRYLEAKIQGEDIESNIEVDTELLETFTTTLQARFNIDKNAKLYVSDSHRLSYYIARQYECKNVYSFDAHTDLGYGGLSSLEFEVNCSNWLGKLLNDSIIETAYIFFSPFSHEESIHFEEINGTFDIKYLKTDAVYNMPNISYIHIARSGAWTPPWLDHVFFELIDSFNRPYKTFDFKHRHWDPRNISLADVLHNII